VVRVPGQRGDIEAAPGGASQDAAGDEGQP